MKPNSDTGLLHRRLWRQGDILIQECSEMPERCEKVKGRVIARGEATGHAHRLSITRGAALFSPPPRRASTPSKPGLMFLRVTAPACAIIHHEHAPITLSAGVYELWRQREFDLVRGQIRTSAD